MNQVKLWWSREMKSGLVWVFREGLSCWDEQCVLEVVAEKIFERDRLFDYLTFTTLNYVAGNKK